MDKISSKRFKFNGNLEDMPAIDGKLKISILVQRIVYRSTSTEFRTRKKSWVVFFLVVLNWYFEIYQTVRIDPYFPRFRLLMIRLQRCDFQKGCDSFRECLVFPIGTVYLHYLHTAVKSPSKTPTPLSKKGMGNDTPVTYLSFPELTLFY